MCKYSHLQASYSDSSTCNRIAFTYFDVMENICSLAKALEETSFQIASGSFNMLKKMQVCRWFSFSSKRSIHLVWFPSWSLIAIYHCRLYNSQRQNWMNAISSELIVLQVVDSAVIYSNQLLPQWPKKTWFLSIAELLQKSNLHCQSIMQWSIHCDIQWYTSYEKDDPVGKTEEELIILFQCVN